MSYNKDLYWERKNKNLCTKCGKETEPNKTLCPCHRQKANKNQQTVFARRRNMGLCYKCDTKLTNNRKTCNKCLEKNIPKDRDEIRVPWTNRKKLGLCIACGKPNPTSNEWCSKCSKKYNTAASLKRKLKVSNGLCGVCGKGLLAKNSETRCIFCIYKHKKWYASSDFRKRRIQKDRLLRDQIIQHYGGKCVCCNTSEKTFLAIDHINGGGNAHRKQIKKMAASSFYKWIIKQNFPNDLQILCYNCNMSKYLLGGLCAHKHKQDGV